MDDVVFGSNTEVRAKPLSQSAQFMTKLAIDSADGEQIQKQK